MRTSQKTRRLKISYALNYPYCVPRIPIQGQWLAAAGFNVGDYVRIEVESGRLVITLDLDRERTALAKTISAMTGELARLKEQAARYSRGREEDDEST